MIYPKTYEQKIGFDKIREMVETRCETSLAKQMATKAAFSTSYEKICDDICKTDEMRNIIMMEDTFPDCVFVDIADLLKKIRIEGTYMLSTELLNLLKALQTSKDITAWLKKCDTEKYPFLKRSAENINIFPTVIQKINDTINKFGQVRDNASPALAQIRRNITDRSQQISKRINAILKSAQTDGIVDDEAAVSVRDGRMVIPVNAAEKKKIKGFIHDESATGKTAYIEPVEIVELNNEIKALEYEEKREVIKILITVADFLRPYIADLNAVGYFICEIDFINAKAKFCISIEAVKPIIANKTIINMQKARHPLLMLALKKEKTEIVPLNINIDAEKHMLLISGPNAGGKSVCLKTVGLLQYMLQCGFLVPASENSEFGIFNDIFIDIGDEQSLENDLSTYSSHLLNMKMMLKNANDKSLVLIDEFGTGTEPAIGGAIAEAVLTQLVEKKVFGIITTHYTNLKHFAANHAGIANGAMLFDTQKIQPLFKLEIGVPGSSFAFEIARKIGLPEDILNAAAQKIGDKQMNMEKSLREIARDKRYWEEKRNRIRIADKHLEEITAKYESELKKLNDERKTLMAKAREESATILAQTNKQIENTIRQIKESQAEKEKTRQARRQLEEFKQNILSNDDEKEKESNSIDRKIEALKQRQERRKQKKNQQNNIDAAEKPETKKEQAIEIGTKVRIKGQSAAGEVIKISPPNVLISYGSIMTTIKLENVEPISNNEYNKIIKQSARPHVGIDIATHRINFKSDIDVRGMRVEEAIPAIENFIDEALMLGYSSLRILHGKGNGILKTQIRNMLKGLPCVESFGDEHVDFGGAGITILKLC